MINEINAALEHLCTLLHPAVDVSKFKSQFQEHLQLRYASLWFPNDSTRASALRAILWQVHDGGEGQDQSLLQACRENCNQDGVVDYFSMPFTLWIDPGCVAIRLGYGPGIYLSTSSQWTNVSASAKIIYGRIQPSMELPVLTVQPSTPALTSNAGPWSSASRYPSTFTHSRSVSSSSMASSHTGTRSTSASSYMSSADGSERCPSLVGTSAQDSDSELSVEDMIDSGCYKNFDIIDDEDGYEGEQNVGDETITEVIEDLGDVTISADDQLSVSPGGGAIVNYDGGNVGVLGGGIRLGSANTNGKEQRKSTIGKPSLQAHQGAFSQYAPPLPPPNSSQGFEQLLGFPAPQQYMMMDGYAIPMNKRVRSRGRRSRGRGAGRAARRQAAALQALTEAEQSLTNSLPILDQHREDFGVEGCEDERIMAIVRQRADQVAKDMVKRHLEQERRKAEAKLHQVQYQHHHHQNSYLQNQHHHHQHHQQQQYLATSLPQFQQPLQTFHQPQSISHYY